MIETEWRFFKEDFRSQLFEQWPDAVMRYARLHQGSVDLDFELPMHKSTLYGTLPHEGKWISFSGDLADCADFAVWCRMRVPTDESVLFCDESVNRSLALQLGTTPAEIIEVMGAP